MWGSDPGCLQKLGGSTKVPHIKLVVSGYNWHLMVSLMLGSKMSFSINALMSDFNSTSCVILPSLTSSAYWDDPFYRLIFYRSEGQRPVTKFSWCPKRLVSLTAINFTKNLICMLFISGIQILLRNVVWMPYSTSHSSGIYCCMC